MDQESECGHHRSVLKETEEAMHVDHWTDDKTRDAGMEAAM